MLTFRTAKLQNSIKNICISCKKTLSLRIFFLNNTMLKRLCFLIVFAGILMQMTAQDSTFVAPEAAEVEDTVSYQTLVMERYTAALEKLVAEKDEPISSSSDIASLNPYYYKMFTAGTLYKEPLQQVMRAEWGCDDDKKAPSWAALNNTEDADLSRCREMNQVLARTYVDNPELITVTEAELADAGVIREDVTKAIKHEVKLSEKAELADLQVDVEPVAVVAKRPNFWKFSGNTSLQFTQSYYSDNWYQGGENNYAMLAVLTLNANYDNKQKIQWENKLEMQLGFQTIKSDEEHNLKTTSDLLRLNSKVGYKATKHWFYTASMQAQTQFHPKYASNSDNVTSDFMSPFNLVLSVGMDYKLNLKNFSGSAYFAPVAYNFKYVDRMDIAQNFGLKPRHSTYVNYGPNITVNYNWKICNSISWSSRLYWFSNLEMTNIEWENTFTFTINKYLSSKLFVYPKIDDSSKGYKSEDMDKYFMFKEWLSLGLNYSF